MDESQIYITSLIVGFFMLQGYGLLILLPIDVDSPTHEAYNRGRKIFGVVLLLWSLYILAHAIFNLRYRNNYVAMSLSLASYYMLSQGFEFSLHTLLDRSYITTKKIWRAVLGFSIYNLLLILNYLYVPDSARGVTISLLAVPLIIRMCLAAFRSHIRYVDVKRNIDNYYSSNISESVVWIKYCIYTLLSLGFFSIFLPYGSALTDAVTMFIALVVITYVLVSLRNYSVTLNNLNIAVIERGRIKKGVHAIPSPIKSVEFKEAIESWVKAAKFTTLGLTIEDVAEQINYTRADISDYIIEQGGVTFRSWISQLRIEYSKELLIKHPSLPIAKIAELAGYARSSYTIAFTKSEGCNPYMWRKRELKW